MKNKTFLLVLTLLNLLLCSCFRNQPMVPKKVLLHDNWTFHKAWSDTVYKARVPGCVHLDLMDNDVIPDPFFGENEKMVQWIENEEWVYETTFRATSLLLNYEHIDLVFEGLDTYADVYLNDSLLLKAGNMFREWRLDVSHLLKDGHNDLRIVFHIPEKVNQEKASELPYTLPDERVFSRKAPYMFGWDWGPRLVTSGMWKPVYFEAWQDLKIKGWKVVTDSLGQDSAKVRLIVDVLANDTMHLDCRYKVSRMDRVTMPVFLDQGMNTIEIPVTIEDPKLWWTHNLGEPFLYDFTVAFRTVGGSIDDVRGRFGLRTVELVHEPDETGKSFYFRLNGVPVFMKGANYIPQDNFPSRVKREKYYETIMNARRANMNMLRIWGGGIYEDDMFYRICDEQGILVWQDFMFACAMYPGDSSFLENVKEEAVQQVKRLRNHPCLALWCGNNEVDEAWHNWGWQEQYGYSEEHANKIWSDYERLFHDILPAVVKEYDGLTDYWPSSPKHGWGRKESLTDGDMHYWGVWWGREPFSAYESHVGRFMSEYGFQGYPPYRTLQHVIPEEELYAGSPSMLNHQKHPFGEEVIRESIQRSYPVPPQDSIADYIYLSQLTQAYGIRTAIEAHRRSMPHCMGTLYWQLNDCWPVISWSGLDHENRWKALHYQVKRSFENIIISPVEENGKLSVYLVNDNLVDTSALLSINTMDFSGNILYEDSVKVEIGANTSKAYLSIPVTSLLDKDMDGNSYALLRLKNGDGLLAQRIYYFDEPLGLQLTEPEIRFSIQEEKRSVSIKISSNVLVKDLFLYFSDHEGRFSDNYVDLLPGEEKTLSFYPTDDDRMPEKQDLRMIHLNHILVKYLAP